MIKSIKELLKRKYLIKYLTISELKVSHQSMVFGHLWWVINPLLWVVVYWLLISVIFKRGEPNYPVFLSCAILPWRSFAVATTKSITSICGQKKLIEQINFPKSILPISAVLSNSVSLLFSFLVIITMGLFFSIFPTVKLVYLPFIILIQLMWTFGICFFLSIIGVYFIDIKNAITFILRIWLYLSPSLYSIERIPERFRNIFMLNPFAPIFISYRDVIIYGKTPHIGYLFIAFLISLLAMVIGFWFFSRQEKKIIRLL